MAKHLLANNDLNISEVCFESGFGDVPYFTRILKKYTGMTPGKYRATVNFK